jgi:uncharacterized repeat protein (TIGR03803 family)
MQLGHTPGERKREALARERLGEPKMKNICTSLIAGAVGCAFIQPASALETAKAKEKVLYSFCGQQNCTDGETPYASLIDVKGTLYGTTAFGGAQTVVHSFGGNDDGSNPYTGLIRANGTLYGTTEFGGAHGAGTVFALHPKTGTEKVLYSFCSKQWKCADGANPYASLIDVNGALYGTTEYGGSHGKGTVFALNPNTGAETVLYTFCSRRKCADGQIPSVSLVAVNGTLYGTTEYGGSGIDGYGYGTVFALDPNTGMETVLYSFCSQQKCADGEIPEAALFAVNGTLYGTTWAGGSDGGGTVFSFDPKAGVETVLHAFSSGGDGQNPGATLIDVNGMLYGTTFAGGAYGDGTVFAIKRP